MVNTARAKTEPRSLLSALPMTKIVSRYSGREIPLHALTILSGHSRETTEEYFNCGKSKEISSYVVWQYTISGRGCIEVNNNCQDLLPGSLMIVTVPGPQNYYLPKKSSHWEFVFLVMIGREVVRINKMIEKRIGNVTHDESCPLTLSLFCEIIDKLFSGAINSSFENSSYTYQLFMRFLAETGVSRAAPKEEPFLKIKEFIKQNVQRDISVEEMAEIMQLSCSHFNRIFGREMGMSPRSYLEDFRIKMAMDILFEENMTVKEAAARCGFYDSNHFCRVFKKRYGISPGRYKELIPPIY